MLQRCTYKNTKKVLNNEDALSYYLLGAFITDGNICQDKSRTNSYKISLCSKDLDWLELIQNSLGGDGTIRKNHKSAFTLWLYGKDIYDWFISNNCGPNKSLTQELPSVPDIYLQDFLRGCMDGDGCISLSKYKSSKNKKLYTQLTTYLCTGSEQFANQLSNKLYELIFLHSLIRIKNKPRIINGRKIVSNNYMYRLQFSGFKRGIPFLKWIYDNEMIAMPRKKQIAQNILQHYKLAED